MLSLAFWAIGLPYWLLVGAFAGLVEIVPVIGPLVAGALAVGVGLTVSWQTALAAGLAVLGVRLLEDYLVIPRLLGDAVGLTPLVVLVAVTGCGLLFGGFAVILAIPLAAVIATLIDVIVRDKDPAEEDVPTVIFSAEGSRALAGYALRQRPKMRPPRVKPSPKVPTANAPTATVFRSVESRFQRPSASCSSVVSGSPRRCLRSAPPARRPR